MLGRVIAGDCAPTTSPVVVPLLGGAAILDGIFLARPNRFVVEAQLPDGQVVRAHMADRGRLLWLRPGMPVWLGAKQGAHRKTQFQIAAVKTDGGWASVDTTLPNRLIELALRSGALPQFGSFPTLRREFTQGASRFDFRLSTADAEPQHCFVEVKSVGYLNDGVGQFPDAPTLRGTRHLNELLALAQGGHRAAVVFVAQCTGAHTIQPAHEIDPVFAATLAQVRAGGVEVYGYAARMERTGLVLGAAVPVLNAAIGIGT
ncbi:MAG: DNA/RNA nuclease SfsA [Herpetosiphon sp.]